ncbi:hypothetical protein JHK82_052191 [Glycine max]|uniref:Uncharacterized protein n=2 Tax=Glycine subgen. Soja TaxID=1462606 RepID=K7MW03_SOYBN|nr:hypothetical protein JHK86_052018 [Glycine max]KAG4914542.1 hypothetical protein JHK87_052099 [Glycine soja]KAG4926391.1 hypothetical protein JHK85_052877 [Glycine max]KAG5082026.1 hypothetical protein JHK84_052064 [Glycine max]KAG5084794.1 hypothetical protein JHK82_052191 [Glycine max]
MCLHISQVTVTNQYSRRRRRGPRGLHLRRSSLIFHCLVELHRRLYHLGLAMRRTLTILFLIYFILRKEIV